MMRRVLFNILISLFGVNALAEPITWSQSVALTRENNPELRSSGYTLESLAAKEGVARAEFFPHIEANLGVGDAWGQTSPSYTAALTVKQIFFTGLQDVGKVRLARANTQVETAALQITMARVSHELRSTYGAAYYAREYLKLTGEIVSRRDANLRLVELRFQGGRENKGSLLLAKANLNQAHYDQLQAKHLNETAVFQLSKVLGVDRTFEVKDQVPMAPPPSPRIDLRALAVETPDFQQAVARNLAADASVTVARSQFFPNLEISASVGKQGVEFFPQSDRWSALAKITIPLFDGGRDYYATKSALAAWEATNSNRHVVDRQMQVKLKQALTAFIEAVEKLKTDDSFREAAVLRSEIARNKYNNGLITFDDWDVIENDLITRQKNYLQSLRDRVLAEAAWEQTLGKGVF